MIVGDVAILPERLKRELIRGEHARAEFAIRAQNALQEALGQMGPIRHIDGIGRKVACIHPELAARIRVKYGSSCLSDPAFLHSLVAANPFLRVQTIPKKLAIRVDGFRDRKTEVGSQRSEGGPLNSGRLEAGARAQNGKGNGARRASDGSARQGDPATPLICLTRRGSSLLVSPGQCSGHETSAHSESR